jgi:hypothetical protein
VSWFEKDGGEKCFALAGTVKATRLLGKGGRDTGRAGVHWDFLEAVVSKTSSIANRHDEVLQDLPGPSLPP